MAVGRAELGSDLTGFRCAQRGVEPDRFLELRLGLSVVAGRLVRAGQAMVGAGLLVPVAGFLGQVQRGAMVGQRLPGLPDGDADFAEAVGCLGFAGQITAAPEQAYGPAMVRFRVLVAAQLPLDDGEPRQGLSTSERIAELVADGQRFLGAR